MPTTPRKARVLLKQKKAPVVHRTPFTIRLMYATGEATQPITLGVDSGYTHVGLSAVSETEEVFAAHVAFRTDLVKLKIEYGLKICGSGHGRTQAGRIVSFGTYGVMSSRAAWPPRTRLTGRCRSSVASLPPLCAASPKR